MKLSETEKQLWIQSHGIALAEIIKAHGPIKDVLELEIIEDTSLKSAATIATCSVEDYRAWLCNEENSQ